LAGDSTMTRGFDIGQASSIVGRAGALMPAQARRAP
jgi:hypothetical protein